MPDPVISSPSSSQAPVSEQLLESIFANIEVGIAYLDKQMRYVRVNKAFAQATGHSTADDFPGKEHGALFPGYEYKTIFQQVIQTCQPYHAYNQPFQRPGTGEEEITYWDWTVEPDKTPDGSVQGAIVLLNQVTQRVEAENRVRAAEARFHTAIENTLDAFVIMSAVRDSNGKIVDFRWEYANESACHENKMTLDEMIGHSLIERLPAHKEAGLIEQYARVIETGEPLMMDQIEYEDTYAGQRLKRVFDILVSRLDDGIAVWWRDITKRSQLEDDLERNERLLSAVLDLLPVGVWVADSNGNIIYANPAGQKIWGGARYVGVEKFGVYKAWRRSTGELIKADEWALARAISRGETSIEEELEIETFDGERKLVLNSALPLRNELGKLSGAIVVVQDITERERLAQELTEVRHRLVQSVEKERQTLAQELHDGPIQDLYGVDYQVHIAADALAGKPERELLKGAEQSLHEIIRLLREITGELRPTTLAPFGLQKAILSHAERFQEMYPTIEVRVNLDPDGQRLPEEIRLGLFRIYQQLMINVARHSQARWVSIHFQLRKHQVRLIVKDNGIGFQIPHRWVEMARQGHLGLLSSLERAQALQGRLSVHSQPGEGTTIEVTIPLHQTN